MKKKTQTTRMMPGGYVSVPGDIRRKLSLESFDRLEFITDDGRLLLRKCGTSCIFCDSESNVSRYDGKPVCSECFEKIKTIDL